MKLSDRSFFLVLLLRAFTKPDKDCSICMTSIGRIGNVILHDYNLQGGSCKLLTDGDIVDFGKELKLLSTPDILEGRCWIDGKSDSDFLAILDIEFFMRWKTEVGLNLELFTCVEMC